MTRDRVATAVLAAPLLLVMFVDKAMAVCPSCKEGLATADRWAQGFNASILFMLVMPFAVVAVIAGAIYRASRRREPPAASEAAEPVPLDPG